MTSRCHVDSCADLKCPTEYDSIILQNMTLFADHQVQELRKELAPIRSCWRALGTMFCEKHILASNASQASVDPAVLEACLQAIMSSLVPARMWLWDRVAPRAAATAATTAAATSHPQSPQSHPQLQQSQHRQQRNRESVSYCHFQALLIHHWEIPIGAGGSIIYCLKGRASNLQALICIPISIASAFVIPISTCTSHDRLVSARK